MLFRDAHMQMTWFKADSYCRNLGMHLAIFETKEEMDAVHDVNPSKGEWGECNGVWGVCLQMPREIFLEINKITHTFS